MSKKALVPVANGTEEIEAVCLIDVLRRAGALVTMASVEPVRDVTCSRTIRLMADRSINECARETFDLIALPGGMPGAEHLRDSKTLTDLLKRQAQEGRFYAAICASPAVVLAHHRLLTGKKATCHPDFVTKLPDQSATNQRVVVDGNCITSRAPGTALEFALKLVALLYDEGKAREMGRGMLVQWP
jgi:4-methyl-5(b-hydroxyethyl)-thiazole monophosphate biosynthesis